VPKQALAWIDLKPAVIDVLLKYEGEIVEALQEYETRNKAWPIGIGYLDAHLEDRILALGNMPKTVYEFIFGLRGNEIAVTNEFRQLFDDDRSDLPVLVAAIEQIAGFERAVTKHKVPQECERIALLEGMAPPTLDWVSAVLNREVNRRRLVKVRDHFTTIHRKRASKFIAAGLSLAKAYIRLEPIAGSALAQKLGLEIMGNQNENASDKLKQRSLELMTHFNCICKLGIDNLLAEK
jgi:hypothetical protein